MNERLIKYSTKILLAILLLGFAVIFFHHLGKAPLIDWDEAIYAQVVRQSLEGKGQIDFHWVGNQTKLNPSGLWMEKPPLMFWLMEVAYKTFGVNEFAVRFWGAIFAFGIVVLSYLFAKTFFSSRAGLFAAASLLLSYYFIAQAFFLRFDLAVGFFILLALYSFLKAETNSRYYWIFWASIGLGVMVKSVIGLLPIAIILLISLIFKKFGFLRQRNFYLGFGLFAAIVLPWHLAESFRHGREFWNNYLFYQVFIRYSSTIENKGASNWFYLQNLKQDLVFFVLSIASFVNFMVLAYKKNRYAGAVVLGVIFIFALFSFSKSKYYGYAVVAYPLLAIMIGVSLEQALHKIQKQSWRLVSTVLLIFCCLLAGFNFHALKLNRYEHSPLTLDNKNIGEYLKSNFQGLPIVAQNRELPALMFYSNKKIFDWSKELKISAGSFIFITNIEPEFKQKQLLVRGPTVMVYLVTIP